MTKRIEIVDCFVENKFQQVNCICEDGNYFCFQDVVIAKTIDNRNFYLPNAIIKEDESTQFAVNRYDPENMKMKVLNKRNINTEYWVELSDLPTLEERLEAEWYDEIENNGGRI